MPQSQPLYMAEFMTGILAALAMKQVSVLSLRRSRLDQAFARLNEDILRDAARYGVDIKFRIRAHPVHQDSTALQQALYEAAQRDLISLDNPEFQRIRLKIDATDAPTFLKGLPGTSDMYVQLADRLLQYYRAQDEELALS
jgi:hypothetical protein